MTGSSSASGRHRTTNQKDGRLTSYRTTPKSPGIFDILEDHAGRIWVTRYRVPHELGSICLVKDAALQCYGQKDGNPATFGLNMTEDSPGDIWFTGAQLYRFHQGSFTAYFDDELNNSTGNSDVNLVAAPSGEIWANHEGVGPKAGVRHFSDGKWASYIVPGFDGRTFNDPILFVDKNQTLWAGSEGNGLYHVHDGRADHYGSADGLSSDHVEALYEDKEGNLWVGTDSGIDMFRDNAVISFSKTQGLAGTEIKSVLAVNGDAVWVSNPRGIDTYETSRESVGSKLFRQMRNRGQRS